jgi:hypothetical protein
VGGRAFQASATQPPTPGRSVHLRIDLGRGLPCRSDPSSELVRRLTDWSVTCHGRRTRLPSQLSHIRKVGTDLPMNG